MKHKFLQLVLFTSIICANTSAQPVIVGQKVIGGNLEDLFSCMALTRDGGLILGGSSLSDVSGEKTDNNRDSSHESEDYWIVKLGRNGNIQWDKTIGGNDIDRLTALQQTKDGGYILGGYSWSPKSGEKTEDARPGKYEDFPYDYWIVKLDNLGNVQWDKTIGGNNYDYLTALQQTNDGGYILGGRSSSDKGYEKSEATRREFSTEPSDDYWVVKLDSKGNIQWDKTMGGVGNDWLTSLQQTTDGGYILGGYSPNDKGYEKTENSRGGYDYWVVKLNSNGDIQWDKTIGGNDYDQLLSLQQTKDGGYVLGGYSFSNKSGEKTQNNRGPDYTSDYWVVKLSHSGNVQWDKTIGGSDGDALTSLRQTTDEGYILGGGSQSNISGQKTENSRGEDDYWVVKLNKNGRIQWDKTIGGSSWDECRGVKEIARNRIL